MSVLPSVTDDPASHDSPAAAAPRAEPGDLLREALRLQELAKTAVEQAVVAERDNGTSWEVIGGVLGVTKSSAHTRFASAVSARNAAAHGKGDAGHDVAMPRYVLESTWSEVGDLVGLRNVKMGLQTMVGSLSRHTSIALPDTVNVDVVPVVDHFGDVDLVRRQEAGRHDEDPDRCKNPGSEECRDALSALRFMTLRSPSSGPDPCSCLFSTKSSARGSGAWSAAVDVLADRLPRLRGDSSPVVLWVHDDAVSTQSWLSAVAGRRRPKDHTYGPSAEAVEGESRSDDRLAAIERRLAALEACQSRTAS